MHKYRVTTNYLLAEEFVVTAESFADAEAKVIKQIMPAMRAVHGIGILSIKKISMNKGDMP